ncbi:ATP-binding protein [Paraclostridium sordellii]|uniref:Two-component signal transduction sensor histidine kinase n=1 Tax=Paraclostridium sordellii TaxID=1505 RepID=A0A0C7LFA1_PARSO|nr:ATP-binding protein [Paeniclostridium sordellii]CEN21892.1 two-component signal transduction sensor histidine kinase [[Clostridium] sordellii] [Paeniclostridium sordellii]CEP41798.1 two-component signal transduction sensor histidine kinase [[Clostridium] sordellii] [Paeniclostridium sordellii]CEP43618.1 two-component signal transduction sensor histidine kinase [[Clostridium] sordellii] [Paeniclostridium sordellii]
MLEKILFWNTVIFISAIIEWVVYKYILDEFSEHRKSNLCTNIGIILLVLITTILTFKDIDPNIKLLTGMILGYLFYLYNYEYSLKKGLLISLVYWMLLIGIDAIGSSIILMINSINSISLLLNDNIFRLELTILSKILLISVIPFIKTLKLQVEFKRKDFMCIIVPIIANIISIVIIFGLLMNTNSKKLVIIIASGIMFLANIALIHLIGNIIKSNNIFMENKLIKEKMNLQYQNYVNLQEAQSKVRKLYHDMKNHITCIQGIYGHNELAEKYIENIKNELDEWKSIFMTGNMILDIILNDKKKICDKNNIDFYVEINFSNCGFMDMLDVCSIFSNMIDNAIEACIKIKDKDTNRFIKIKGTMVNGFFVIKCENSKINDIKFKYNNIKTDKKNSYLHGIGVKSIKSSVQKYDGDVFIDYQDYIFIVKIYIPII